MRTWPRDAAENAARRVAARLARDPRVRLVYLFGSAADAERRSVRDLDLAVLCDPPLSLDDLMRLRADVLDSAGPTLDLVSLNRCPVVLAKEVADTGRCLFAASPELETEFVVRARARYWDFKPVLEEQWRLLGERLEERRGGPET
jgi:predicted nucleotidyltransferase